MAKNISSINLEERKKSLAEKIIWLIYPSSRMRISRTDGWIDGQTDRQSRCDDII